MKPDRRIQMRQSGSVLMVTLVVAALIGIVLASYLALVQHQAALAGRSQSWHAALAAAEAGVEEALAQLNPGVLGAGVNRSANGWTRSGGAYAPPGSRPLLNCSYEVRFTDTANPIIFSKGFATNTALKVVIDREVEVRTTNAPLFNAALVVSHGLDARGYRLRTDSYNSTNGPYSSGSARAQGDVASRHGPVSFGEVTIRGDLLTGPLGVSGASLVGAGGVVGDMSWSGPGIQPDHYSDDFNVDWPAVGLPALGWFYHAASITNIGGKNYQYAFLNSGAYRIDGCSGSILIGPNAEVDLYIAGNVNITGSDTLRIREGARLRIYMEGAEFVLNGWGLDNWPASPLRFVYYGLPSNTSVTLGGSTAGFFGSVYAPQALVRLNTGGDFHGALVSHSVRLDRDMRVHFDEALSTLGPVRGYVVTLWREL